MDDLGCNRQSGKASESESWSIGEAFRVDDLLDFSNEDIGGPIGVDEAFSDSSVTEVEACSESPERNCSRGIRTPNVVEADGHLHSQEFYVPNDALEELEWLSNFIDDSDVCTDDAQEFAPGSAFSRPDHQSELAVKENQCKQSAASVALENRTSCVLSPRKAVPGRARSKRPRGTASHFSLFCNTGFETRSAVFLNVVLVENRSSQAEASVCSRPSKKAKKGTQIKKTQDGSEARRCSHCLSQKTPQWRTGPLGPKTLCNACGVRFKSGRLLPEYRPALSPTFSSEIHSNCHRKVVEIRRQKEHQQREQTPTWKAETSSVDERPEAAEAEGVSSHVMN